MTLWHLIVAWFLLMSANADLPSANRLIAETLGAEATWSSFPGCVADVEVHWKGRTIHGRAVIEGNGRVFLEHLPEAHRIWAAQQLGWVVAQRAPHEHGLTRNWLSVDFCGLPAARQPVYRTDDPFGSLRWTPNEQLQAVEVRHGEHKLRITMLATQRNAANKHLPTALVLHRWSLRDPELQSTSTMLLGWRRIEGFDVPVSVQLLSARASSDSVVIESGKIVLSRYQFLPSAMVVSR